MRDTIADAARLGSWALIVGALALGAAACATARAATVPDGPPLEVPAPPPREIAPVEELAVTPPEPEPPEPAVVAVPRPAARPPARQEPRNAEAPAPAPAATPPAPPAPAPEPREVRGVTAAAAPGEEKKVREVMFRASRDLKGVDYGKLSVQGKDQYDQSKRFSEQAEQALKERNYVYAMTLADKAATIAAELAAR